MGIWTEISPEHKASHGCRRHKPANFSEVPPGRDEAAMESTDWEHIPSKTEPLWAIQRGRGAQTLVRKLLIVDFNLPDAQKP